MERQHAAIHGPVEDLAGNLPRRHPPDLDQHLRVERGKPLKKRQQRVHGGLVRADHHAAAANVLQLTNRDLGVGRQPQEPRGVVLEQHPGLGERAIS
jgi:hypothetical protein